jgi:thiamine transport system substrate-binding protein
MAFLLTTVAAYGAKWPDYWVRLMHNDTKLTDGWSDAYQVDFTQGGGKGDRPIVLSYDSSPAFTIADDGTSTTSALLDTCFRQVEYAGVLDGAENPDGAKALVDFLLTPEVQAALPDAMYVFPVDSSAKLPAEWAKFAKQPTDPFAVDPADIAEHRDEWLRTWSDVTSR